MTDTPEAEKEPGKDFHAGSERLDPAKLQSLARENGYEAVRAGRLVYDPAEAAREYGEEVASMLKTDKGGVILWPQPDDSPLDPQNWSERKKLLTLIITAMSAWVPDFDSALGIATVFPTAAQYDVTTQQLNNLTSNWSIFQIGTMGFVWVFCIRRFGRLPVIFWTQLFALGWLIGCTFAPTLKVYAAMRILQSSFATCTQVSGLYVLTDIYPAHRQDKALAIWLMAFVLGPFVSPFLGGFMAAFVSWRWVYGWGCFYGALVVLMIALFQEETIYDRYIWPRPERPTTGLRYRIETLVGITGWKLRRHRATFYEAVRDMLDVAWRPQTIMVSLYIGSAFGFGIGLDVTQAVFLGSPAPIGYGYSQVVLAGFYATPIVAVILSETLGAAFITWVTHRLTRLNHGVFEAEQGWWLAYLACPIFVVGMVLIGYSFQELLNPAGVIFGWGLAEIGIFMNTLVGYSYLNFAFPTRRGEVSAILNFARTAFGFAVPFYVVSYSVDAGASVAFGVEASVVAGLFLLVVPVLQWKGKALRNRFSIRDSALGRL